MDLGTNTVSILINTGVVVNDLVTFAPLRATWASHQFNGCHWACREMLVRSFLHTSEDSLSERDVVVINSYQRQPPANAMAAQGAPEPS